MASSETTPSLRAERGYVLTTAHELRAGEFRRKEWRGMDNRAAKKADAPDADPEAHPQIDRPARDGESEREGDGAEPVKALAHADYGGDVTSGGDIKSADVHRGASGGSPDRETEPQLGDPARHDDRDAHREAHVPDAIHASGAWRPSAAQAWRRIRDERPSVVLVGTLSEGVSDALAALGARPARTFVPDEAPGLYASCGAVVIDAGATLSDRWGHGIGSVRARSGAPPLLLIASLVDRSPLRCNEARRFVAEARPSVIRGTVSELSALVGLEDAPGTGHAAAASIAQVVAHRTGAIAVAWTDGEVATADPRTMRSAAQSGTPAQVRIAAHALDAAIASILACGADPLAGVRAALAVVESAIQAAARPEHGPGSFAAALLDTLSGSGEFAASDASVSPDDDPRTPVATASAESATAQAADPDLSRRPFPSMVDAVANRFEGGRVVPGSVPVHLLRQGPDHSATHSLERWTRALSIEVRTAADTGQAGHIGTQDDPIAHVVTGAIRAGASAVVVDVAGMSDANAVVAIRRVGAEAAVRAIAVAVRGRVDLAIAGGADGVWLDTRSGAIAVDAAVAVASGRAVVIAEVASESEAHDAIGAGAGVICAQVATGDRGAVDLGAIAEAAGVGLGAILTLADGEVPEASAPERSERRDPGGLAPDSRPNVAPEPEADPVGRSEA